MCYDLFKNVAVSC